MTAAMWIIFGLVAFVSVALLMHLVVTVGDRIAHGGSLGPRGSQDLRAEDAVSGRRGAGRPDAAEAILDRKRGDGSGLAGL